MLDLTRQERGFFLFLLVFFVLGAGVSIYKRHIKDSRALSPEQSARQQAFLGQFRNRNELADAEGQPAENVVVFNTSESNRRLENGYPARSEKLITGKIDLNQAKIEDLIKLPRVGPVMARRIIEYRQVNGPFKRIEELKKVKGIGQKTFEKISPYIIVKTN